MAQDFLPVPDWFSWENQGVGVAVAEFGVLSGPSLTPPGWYMLFLVDDRGLPSEAHRIQVR